MTRRPDVQSGNEMTRNRITILLLTGALGALVAAAAVRYWTNTRSAPPAEPPALSLEGVQGTWKVVKVESPGRFLVLWGLALDELPVDEIVVQGQLVTVSQLATLARTITLEGPGFSHAQHTGQLGIACAYCHTDKGNVPADKLCMNCHQQAWEGAKLLDPVRTGTVPAPALVDPKFRLESSYRLTLDTMKSPVQADLVACDKHGVPVRPELIGRAIVKHEDDTLVIAVAVGGPAVGFRPDEFKASPVGPNRPAVFLLTLKK